MNMLKIGASVLEGCWVVVAAWLCMAGDHETGAFMWGVAWLFAVLQRDVKYETFPK